MAISGIRAFFDDLNHEYLAVHRRKEEFFWAIRMAMSDDNEGIVESSKNWEAFIADPDKLAAVRERIAALEAATRSSASEDDDEARDRRELLAGLEGWRALFAANVIESDTGRTLMERIVSLESELFAKRRKLVLRHRGERGDEEATLGMLLTNEMTNASEAARKSSHDVLRGLEAWVLDNGFLDIVRARNAFARSQGFRNYFEYKVGKFADMRLEELFAILDDFENRTAAANRRGLDALARSSGGGALEPWNLRYFMNGDVLRETDRYFPFSCALERWVKSFSRLGIRFRGATMQLDLLQRKGKYQNGFCHGPVPAFYDHGVWIPAHVNFTSEGRPDQVGSGFRAIRTLFHEGGHAAHFANIAREAPCFSQEFPPTSMVCEETQSMFCESLLEDPDWLMHYARTEEGLPMPLDLIRKRVERRQPYRAFEERLILVVPYFERELYALADDELGAARVLDMARETERRILGVESHRPLLSIPHLMDKESAASFHSYLLAHMAVCQTRAWFLREYGFIVDNPALGPLLAERYWAPGNSLTQDQMLRSLTGEGFSARYLADDCDRSVEQAWTDAETSMSEAAERSYPSEPSAELDANIRIVDGAELLADNSISEKKMCEDFAARIRERYPVRP